MPPPETREDGMRVLAEAMKAIEAIQRRLGSELPSSRELSLANTKLDEARLWLAERHRFIATRPE